jgi:hypothetical protein
MSLPLFGILGLGYILARKNKADSPSVPDDGGRDDGLDPSYPPQAVPDQFSDMEEITWDNVYQVGNDVVWAHGVLYGLKYDDGTDTRRYEYHYLIGSVDHKTFTSDSTASSGLGHIQIDGSWAKVYADEQAAISEVDRMNVDDGSGVSPQPQPQPQPDDDDVAPSLPPYVKPSYGFDGFNNSYFNGGL